MRMIVPVVLFAAVMGSPELRVVTHAQGTAPAFARAPDALERVTWRTRTLVGDNRLARWKFAIPASGLTFLEAVVRADAAIVDFVEGSSTQKVSPQIQKNLDFNLSKEEIAAIKARMGNVKLLTYRVDALGDAASQRNVFEFAKALGADTIVTRPGAEVAGLDALAAEFDLKVAVLSAEAKPLGLVKELEGRGRKLGIGIDTGLWAQEGVAPREGLAAVKDRLFHLSLRD